MNYTDILKYSTLFVISFIVFYFIYWNIAKHNIIQYYYYSIHNKLFSVYNEKFDYYNIFLVLSFSFIIIIITIVLYWTILYNTAKKNSNCAEILTIIEENAVSKSPYVYTFAIIDKDNIEDKLSYFLLKIRYDFNTRNTKIEYGKDLNGENKLFDKLLLDYERKLFLRAGDKLDKDNTVFKDTEESRKLQKDILSIVKEITIDNYYEKLPKITQDTLFTDIFNELNSSILKDGFTNTIDIKIREIRNDKTKLDNIRSGYVIVKSWKKFLPTAKNPTPSNLGYTDVSIDNKPIDYYKDELYNNNSYVLIAGEYYVPNVIETDTNNLKNKTLDEINQNLKDIFDFLLDYLELQLNYPLESVNSYFIMQSRDSNKKKLRYYDLASMKIKIIDGVYIDKIDNDFFKIVSVDKYNKIHKTHISMKLLDFTRYNATYEKNGKNEDFELYSSDNIIYNIIYANKNKDKISL